MLYGTVYVGPHCPLKKRHNYEKIDLPEITKHFTKKWQLVILAMSQTSIYVQSKNRSWYFGSNIRPSAQVPSKNYAFFFFSKCQYILRYLFVPLPHFFSFFISPKGKQWLSAVPTSSSPIYPGEERRTVGYLPHQLKLASCLLVPGTKSCNVAKEGKNLKIQMTLEYPGYRIGKTRWRLLLKQRD